MEVTKNRDERLRENRRDYQGNFLLGFGRGRGLLSAFILTLYNFLNRKNPKEYPMKEEKSPDQFDIIE